MSRDPAERLRYRPEYPSCRCHTLYLWDRRIGSHREWHHRSITECIDGPKYHIVLARLCEYSERDLPRRDVRCRTHRYEVVIKYSVVVRISRDITIYCECGCTEVREDIRELVATSRIDGESDLSREIDDRIAIITRSLWSEEGDSGSVKFWISQIL